MVPRGALFENCLFIRYGYGDGYRVAIFASIASQNTAISAVQIRFTWLGREDEREARKVHVITRFKWRNGYVMASHDTFANALTISVTTTICMLGRFRIKIPTLSCSLCMYSTSSGLSPCPDGAMK